jgi:MATE family multidrug resistance protein
MFGATALWSRAPTQVRIDRASTIPAVLELVHLGWPIAGTLAVEILLFTAGALMAGILGPTALAAHQVAISVASTTFMVPMSIGQAANGRGGFFAGARLWEAARRAGHAAFTVGVGFMGIAALVLLLLPRPIALLFNLDPANPNDSGVIALIVRLLVITAFFQVFDGAQTIAAGALRGYKDTRVPMVLASFGYWALGFPVAWVLAFPAGLAAVGIWWGFAIGLAATALVLGWRYERLSVRLITTAAA